MTPEAMEAMAVTSVLLASFNTLVTLCAFIINAISNLHIIVLGLIRFSLAIMVISLHQPWMLNDSENIWRLVMLNSVASTGIFGISACLVMLNMRLEENVGIYVNMFVMVEQIANVAIMNLVLSTYTNNASHGVAPLVIDAA